MRKKKLICDKCQSSRTKTLKGRLRCRRCDQEYQRSWYRENLIAARNKAKLSMRKIRSDPKRRAELNAKYRGQYTEQQHIYSQNLRRKHFFRWRARNWGNGVTAQMLYTLWHRQMGLCALSGRKLTRTAHLDHIVSASNGGLGGIENIRWVDSWANMARQSLTDQEFRIRCKQVAEFIGRCIVEADK